MSEQVNQEGGKKVAQLGGQYARRIVLDAPNSPEIFSLMKNPPEVNIECTEDYRVISEEKCLYESIINIKAEAKASLDNAKKIAFRCEIEYCGMLTIKNLSEEEKESALMISTPELLFPFARSAMAELTIKAGFPPLMIDPINFKAKYEKKKYNQESSNKAN